MKEIIRLTESDLTRIVKRIITESNIDLYNMAIDRIEKNPSGSMKSVESYVPTTQEETTDKNFYITFIKENILNEDIFRLHAIKIYSFGIYF